MNQHVREHRARFREQPVDRAGNVRAIFHAKRRNTHGFRHAAEIGIVGEIHFAVALVVEQFLPLAHHP
jgi:hypothetical protein